LRGEWRDVAAKPEEIVRQTFLRHLVDHYSYSLAQIDQERRTQHGHKSPRADIVIWESAEKKANNNTPVLVVECKAEGVDINVKDYYQGESYTRGRLRILHRAQYALHRRVQAGAGIAGRFRPD
jgi:type I restriction enzyme M protein